MSRVDYQPRLDELRLAAQRISTNLVELEVDPSLQLVQTMRLEGRSAERWATASDALTELWRRHYLLEAWIERAEGLRGPRHRDDLRALIEGASIELTTGSVSLAERQLLGTARSAQSCSPEQMLGWMAAAFEEVKGVIAELTGTWERLTPKLDATRRLATEVRKLADEVGAPIGEDGTEAARSVDRLTRQLASDPLSVAPQDADELERELRSLRDGLEESAALRRGFEARLGDSRERLERLRAVVVAGQEAQRELVLKITLPSPPLPLELDPEWEAELRRIAELGPQGRWDEARLALKAWTAGVDSELAAARRHLDASRTPIQTRNQFRALLDAYRVKAERLGRLEDPELQRSFAEAHQLLYNAPSDLALAAQLVRSFQLALINIDPAAEMTA